MSRVILWVAYEIVGEERRETLEAVKKLIENDAPHRRMIDNNAFVILKPKGVNIDFTRDEEIDPAQMGLDLEARVSICIHGIALEVCEKCKLEIAQNSAEEENSSGSDIG